MENKNILLPTILFLSFLFSCNNKSKNESLNSSVPGIIIENMDLNINPKDNFYGYVNGNWTKTTQIPDDETRWGGFGVLRKSTRQDVLEIIKTSKELGTYSEGSDQKKALLVFESELDTLTRNKFGIKPIVPFLNEIDKINSLKDLQEVYCKNIGISNPFIGLGANPDLNNSSVNIGWIYPGGLGLQRDYYVDNDEKTIEIRKKYTAHISKMLQFINFPADYASSAAERILELETKLAIPRLDKVQSRDIRNFNNPKKLNELDKLTPAFDWIKFLLDMGIDSLPEEVIVMQPNYMIALNEFLLSTSIEDLKILMKWSTLDNSARYLSTEIEKTNWEFYSKTLSGAKKQRDAEQRALGTVSRSVGEAIGRLYVEAKFPPEAKQNAEKMISNVIKAFQIRIDHTKYIHSRPLVVPNHLVF